MLYPRTAARRSMLVAALALATAAACGDNAATPMPDAGPAGDAPPDSGLDEDGCRILALGERDFSFNIFAQLLGVRFRVTPNLDEPRRDVLRIELYDSTTPDLPPLAPGTFDLSAVTNLATCQHCVWLDVDENEDGTVDAIYFAAQGTLTIDKIADPLDSIFAGHTGRVVLRRATVDEQGQSTFVPGGDCVSIAELRFDTTPTPGKTCQSAEECGNPLLEICNPDTNTCSEPQCGEELSCDTGETCLVQYRDGMFGACYQACTPGAAGACGSGKHCVQLGPNPASGICKVIGTGTLGARCELEDNVTSCAGPAACSQLSETCGATCSFYAQDPGCPAGSVCSLFGVCEPPAIGNGATLGATCGPDSELVDPCGADNEAFRGMCFAYEDRPLVCEKVCFVDQGCGSGEFCAQRFDSGLGACKPLPVCGDGVRGEINETCDDGNTMDGDACSADCKTADVDFMCGAASALAVGATAQGNTLSGRDGLMSSCQVGLARAHLYTVTPPGRGRVRVRLTSQSSQTLSMRTTCADAATELGCGGQDGLPTDEELIVQVTDAAPAPLAAMVSAITVLDEGPYTIAAEFVPELCGDGIIAGREVCDDGNATSNDGCSSTCRVIEYGALCTLSPTLSTTTLNTGTLDGAMNLYGASCAIDEGAARHPSRMYRYTAPAAGNLHLQLQDGTSFAVLAVRDGCGTPAATTELACRPAFLNGEIDVALAAGQTITVTVVSYDVDRGLGTYTLAATFTPQ